LAPVYLSSATMQLEAAKALADFMAANEIDSAGMTGSFGIDPIGAAALAGTEPDLSAIAEGLELAKPFPLIKPFVVDATIYHNAGAGDVHEVAYALGVGIEYVRAMVDAGLSVDDAF